MFRVYWGEEWRSLWSVDKNFEFILPFIREINASLHKKFVNFRVDFIQVDFPNYRFILKQYVNYTIYKKDFTDT